MLFFSISLPLAFLTFWTGSAPAAKVEARKGAVRNVQICRNDRGEASLARASAQAARPSPEGVIGSMSRSVGKWIVFVDDGVFIAVILGGRHDAVILTLRSVLPL
jgi:hypothetical protein